MKIIAICICTKSGHDHDGKICGKKIDDKEIVCTRCGVTAEITITKGCIDDMGLGD
ncbi:MAG: hypothetical protein HYT08_03870 [Candidatus Levybacteria bacterium]|nr:hypothetical protein [Candidatus Levybacteria bacterium]